MKYYLISFIITFIFLVISFKTKDKHLKRIFAILSMIPFILVSGFRGDRVGIDTSRNYIFIYNLISKYGSQFNVLEILNQKYSFGFAFLMNTFIKVFRDPTYFILFCSFIIIFFTFLAIYKESKNPPLSLIIFFLSGSFLLSMNGMRQYMAMAIVLYSIRYVKERNLKKFLLFMFLAISIHASTIIFLILYPLYNIKLKKRHIALGLFISILSPLFISTILRSILNNTRYVAYFFSGVHINPLYSMLIINIILLLLFLFNYKRYHDENEYNLFLFLQIMSVMICCCSFTLTQSYRIEQMIDYFQILSIPYAFYLFKKNKKIDANTRNACLVVVILLFSIYFTRSFIFSDDNQVLDYYYVTKR